MQLKSSISVKWRISSVGVLSLAHCHRNWPTRWSPVPSKPSDSYNIIGRSMLRRTRRHRRWHAIIVRESCKFLCPQRQLLAAVIMNNFIIPFINSLGCETTTNCIVGGSALGSRKETPFETGKRAGEEIVHSVEPRACVDQYMQVCSRLA